MKLLIIEDDETLFKAMKSQLEKWDWSVHGINDFGLVFEEYKALQPDMVIIDIQLPQYDGFYWCRAIRKQSNIPIVFLSSRDHPMDQVMSMELGADDFIQKPFHTEVLVAKLQAIYRRVYQYNKEEPRIKLWNKARVDYGKHVIEKDDNEISLTKNEMFILEILLNHKNEVVSRDTIITALWDDEQFVSDNTLTVNVNRLRKKLTDIGLNDLIETKVGKGYIAHELEG
ncbi:MULTISPECIES: response regulator transcription factor [Mammaliicoccus]|uniref:Response regulator protein GraR n=1 Tax=Mammaliicoccus fleurettii TaxID=150056 RepID=A0ABS5ML74_9STAP|nr:MULTISPECIES: response regulator transcription factor [Mammaliicoccus]HCN60358.1 DNA-binding response regulator [Staphylococcus sp.]MBL0846302.1 response regulator transcription factor [Mammaliicoccus fleurettii]MBS3671378.1 response regulator transcription factor [Mammaliicoccus fleurettii]MBS3696668.1 response regulator transcription factor [Mammaliicoccus fleurettii]MBW0765611.1 response regulator transcription factor [Mammaliicoccus fleurettii]